MELKVVGLIERKNVRIGDIISYPEGSISIVSQPGDVNESYATFQILQGSTGTPYDVRYWGVELTYYGNLFDFKGQSIEDWRSLEDFKRWKLSDQSTKSTKESLFMGIKLGDDRILVDLEHEDDGIFVEVYDHKVGSWSMDDANYNAQYGQSNKDSSLPDWMEIEVNGTKINVDFLTRRVKEYDNYLLKWEDVTERQVVVKRGQVFDENVEFIK